MRLRKYFAILLILPLWLSACAGADELSVSEVWARPAAAGENSAVYFIINNPTSQDDSLLSADSKAARAVELHMSMMMESEETEGEMSGEVMRMQPQESVAVPAGGEVNFEPGGLHVMLIDLGSELKAGDTISLTLQFERAGELSLQVPVEIR